MRFPRQTVLLFVDGSRLAADRGDAVEIALNLIAKRVSARFREDLVARGVANADSVIGRAAFALESRDARSNKEAFIGFSLIV